MEPVVDGLIKEYEGTVEIKKMNVETDQDASALANKYNAQYVPTFIFLDSNGKQVQMLVGEQSEAKLKQGLDALK